MKTPNDRCRSLGDPMSSVCPNSAVALFGGAIAKLFLIYFVP